MTLYRAGGKGQAARERRWTAPSHEAGAEKSEVHDNSHLQNLKRLGYDLLHRILPLPNRICKHSLKVYHFKSCLQEIIYSVC